MIEMKLHHYHYHYHYRIEFFANIYPSCTKFINHADETENIEVVLQNSNMIY